LPPKKNWKLLNLAAKPLGIFWAKMRSDYFQTKGTSKEIASFEGSPRFARRLIRIVFSGQKRIGDFERRKEKFLIIRIKLWDSKWDLVPNNKWKFKR